MQDELQAFLEVPSARHYRRVREALCDEVATLPDDALAPAELVELTELAAAGDFAALMDRCEQMQPAWALSPRVDYFAAVAAEETGEAEVAELERFTFQACLDGILATGDGSARSPYVITYLSDEYDVRAALGLEPRSQSVVERRGLLCDVVKCLDGEELWFDLTGVLHDVRQRPAEFAALGGLRF